MLRSPYIDITGTLSSKDQAGLSFFSHVSWSVIVLCPWPHQGLRVCPCIKIWDKFLLSVSESDPNWYQAAKCLWGRVTAKMILFSPLPQTHILTTSGLPSLSSLLVTGFSRQDGVKGKMYVSEPRPRRPCPLLLSFWKHSLHPESQAGWRMRNCVEVFGSQTCCPSQAPPRPANWRQTLSRPSQGQRKHPAEPET